MPSNAIRRLRAFPVAAALSAALSCLVAGAPPPAAAQAAYDDPTKPEGWAWARIKEGKDVDFDDNCRQEAPKPFFWRDEPQTKIDCRTLPASFLVKILTQPSFRDQIPSRGITIIGALIDGDVDLRNARLNRALSIMASRLEGDLVLDSVRTDSEISITGSHFLGEIDARRLRSEMSLTLSGSTMEKPVSLRAARIEGALDLKGSTLKRMFMAGAAQVRSLVLEDGSFQEVNLVAATVGEILNAVNATVTAPFVADSLVAGRVMLTSRYGGRASFQAVRLVSAKVAGSVTLTGATFAGSLNLNSISGKQLFMGSTMTNRATFKDVNLVAARIDGNVEMDGSIFDGFLDAHAMVVGGSLFMGLTDDDKVKYDVPGVSSFKRVDLNLVKVAGHLNMEDATFDGPLTANSLEVGGNLYMCSIKSKEKISLTFSRITGSLDTRGASLTSLDLEGASISGDLKLGKHQKGPQGWGDLNLKNARVTNLIDVADAWPPPGHLHIAGFTFSRLGDHRDPWWWDKYWIQHDPQYTPGPYEQLAAAFAAAGNRGAADEMRFLGRARERERETHPVAWLFAVFLQYVAGFGIGDYTFRVLYWVIGISLLGAIYLWYAVPAAQAHGRLWCFGASLNRLLPMIEINKEFTDFFDDPERKRLTGLQSAVFSGICLLGWLLGAILVAAVTGLTQTE